MPKIENDYNTQTQGHNALDDDKEVGPNCVLELAGGGEVPVTNVSLSEESETSEVQYTSGFWKSIAVTGVTYSGSFETAGNADNIRDAGWAQGPEQTSHPTHIKTLTLKDSTSSWTFHNVLMNTNSKDVPSDDRVTHSFDFMAEKLVKE